MGFYKKTKFLELIETPAQGEGGQEGALAGVHHLHLLRRGPRGLPCY